MESTLHPAHLVFATGAYGPPKWLDLPGASDFQGEILHSSQYSDGARFKNKKVAVIGAASSGHDVSVDLWEAGAEVTMIQRNPTTVVRSDTLMDLAFDIYSEQATADGIDVDKADLIAAATPFALQPAAQRALYERIRARDADFYQRLQATGFLLDFGDDETGLMMKAYRTGSGYYVDVGASELIINGDIKVKAGVAIDTLTPTGIRFADGTEIAADAIIQSTGFQSMHEVVAATGRPADRRRRRPLLGPRLRPPQRPAPLARRAAQHVQAHRPGKPVVPGRQPRPLALLQQVPRPAAESPLRGHPHPRLRPATDMIDAVALTQELVRFDTRNPPGDEAACMRFLATLLESHGFAVTLSAFGVNRLNLVARRGEAPPPPSPATSTSSRSAARRGRTTRSAAKSSTENSTAAAPAT